MPLDSATEETFSRSVHFEAHTKEEALTETAFYQEQIAYYVANVFGGKTDFTLACEQTHDTDREFTVRKGSALITVKAVFGINTSYREQPPRKFYTFTTTATRRNETLDTTEKANEVIEWALRIAGGIVFGGIALVLLILLSGHVSFYFIVFAFGIGSGIGGFLGHLIGRKIYHTMETRLEARGEITEVDSEWSALIDTLTLVFDSK